MHSATSMLAESADRWERFRMEPVSRQFRLSHSPRRHITRPRRKGQTPKWCRHNPTPPHASCVSGALTRCGSGSRPCLSLEGGDAASDPHSSCILGDI